MDDSTFHALLVGADAYATNRLLNGGSFRPLGGCVNDAIRIEAMLTERVRGHRLAITRLLAPTTRAVRGAAPPTALNLRRALAALVERARPGDQVYIHFSGHGARVCTAWPDLKGPDGCDLALVPIDIGRSDYPDGSINTRPERYLRDVELAGYIDRLASKVDPATGARIAITLVLDCGHSGGAPRGAGELARRSATGGAPGPGDPSGTVDQRPVAVYRNFSEAARAAMAASHLRLMLAAAAAHTAGTPPARAWLPPAPGYVLLAACGDDEAALECALDGRPRSGVLTDALLGAIASLGADQTWRTVHDRILARIHGRLRSQTPRLLGDLDRHVLGVPLAPVPHAFSVTAVDHRRRTITIDGGLAANVTSGTELGIYRPGTADFSLPGARLAVATVVEASGQGATATIDPPSALSWIDPGAPAVVQALALQRRVELLRRADLPPAIAARQDAALAAVAEAIANDGRGFLQTCAAGITPHYQVAVSPSGTYEICDPQGKPFPHLAPAIELDAASAARSVVARLRRLGRYHTVLEMAEPGAELWEHLRVELLAPPPDWTGDRPTEPIGGTPLSRAGDAYTIAPGTWLWLRVTNSRPDAPVNVALLDLSRAWDIELLVPRPGDAPGKRYETVVEARTFAFRLHAPDDRADERRQPPESAGVLKLFVSTDDADFPSLATSSPRAAPPRAAGGALGRLIDALNATEHRLPVVLHPRSAASPWSVRELRIRTVPP
jgi:hypothetical protein